MNIIELNHIDLNSIGLNSKIIDGVGKSYGGKVKPYIKGHVTDGSSTFTFTVNGNESVTVPVDANGNWKWVVDRTITSFLNSFFQKTNCDYYEVYIPKCPTLQSIQAMFKNLGYNGSAYVLDNITVVIKALDTINVTTFYEAFTTKAVKAINFDKFTSTSKVKAFTNAFNMMGMKTLDLRGIDVSSATDIRNQVWWSACETIHIGDFLSNPNVQQGQIFNSGSANVVNVTANSIKISQSLQYSNKLTEQSVVNLFNAVAADGITLTFHATVYAMIEEQLEIEGSPIYEAYWNSDYDFNYASA